jgi:hypothetical protein
MQTGFFGSPNRVTKCHAVKDGKPICGCKIGIDLNFQWCANGVVWKYINCQSCKNKIVKERCDEIKKLKC